MTTDTRKSPSFLDACIPLFTLVCLLALGVFFFGSDSSYGPNQISLIAVACLAAVIGMKNGFSWQEMEEAMVHGIGLAMGAILILLSVGALIGTWFLSGTVPTLIYLGLQVLSPDWFYAASCVMCAIVAISIGSSWTTAATIGVALIGIATGLGLSPAITAGAIISGAYFGDKLSPLSETTNLAPSIAGSKLFVHIKNMLWTTVPSFVLALIIFIFIGLNGHKEADLQTVTAMNELLLTNFDISIIHLVPLVVLLTLAIKQVPAFPAILIGATVGGIWAGIFQGDLIQRLSGVETASFADKVIVIWRAFFDGVVISTGNAKFDDLLSGGGMSNMLNTTWLIMSALMFGAVMEKTGLLQVFVRMILSMVKTTAGLISSTIFTCFGVNIIASDQYMSIVMPGRMYKDEFDKRGLDSVNLSRALEDGGTITSALIPWNTCGAYMAGVLLVPTMDYFYYCFFNLFNPLLALLFAVIGFKVIEAPKSEPKQAQATA